MNRKDTLYLIASTGLSFLLCLLLFGLDEIEPSSNFSISIYDTYYVTPKWPIILLVIVFVFFSVYLFRAIMEKFNNVRANLILIVTSIVLILAFGKITNILTLLAKPSNGSSLDQGAHAMNDFIGTLTGVLFYTQIVLLVFLTFCGFKMGQKIK
ncbi:hypothetical protein [Zobellia nedashkovskayae]|uniref:hypothetical protein n=1 Tax=Zobellia nedashkovskayae TaxID=2779510 RepID=UPI00188A8516|nr:hypothetical protein [Zobellia nedashkovskayae]